MSRELVRQNGRGTTWNSHKDSDKELREPVHQDTEKKPKFCLNPTFHCSLHRLDGYDYCLRHILRDVRSNYRQCTYLYYNGRKCINAVIKADTRKDPTLTTLCFEHNRQTQLNKTHLTVGKLRQIETNEILLGNLINHMNIDEARRWKIKCEQDEEIDVVTPHVSTFGTFRFIPHEHVHSLSDITAAIRKRRRVLDYASDSSSDDEPKCLGNTSRAYECDESGNESIESQDDDLLNHASVYTEQEAICISEAKLTKLQGLYIGQINRLHHLLREKRRTYLQEMRKEREKLCSIHDQVRCTPRENVLYNRLKALNSYHRRHGYEAVLYKQFKDKRSRSGEIYPPKPVGSIRCTYTEGGVKCGERTLPSSKFCRKHILEDKKQILFKACEVEKSGIKCREPVTCVFEKSTCILHLPIPTQRVYVKTKYESETEEQEAAKLQKNKAGKVAKVNRLNRANKLIKDELEEGKEGRKSRRIKLSKRSKKLKNNKTFRMSKNSKAGRTLGGNDRDNNKFIKPLKDLRKEIKESKSSKEIKESDNAIKKEIKKEGNKESNKDSDNKDVKKELTIEIKNEIKKEIRYNKESLKDNRDIINTKYIKEHSYPVKPQKDIRLHILDEKILPFIRNIKVEKAENENRTDVSHISNIKIEIKKEKDDYPFVNLSHIPTQHFSSSSFIQCQLKQEQLS